MSFQERLRHYREKAGYKSAKDFAAALGLGYTTYVAYENKEREPRYKTLCHICHLLNITPNDLLDFHDTRDELKQAIDFMESLGFQVTRFPKNSVIEEKYAIVFTIQEENGNYTQQTFYVKNKKDLIKLATETKNSPFIKNAYRDNLLNRLTRYAINTLSLQVINIPKK